MIKKINFFFNHVCVISSKYDNFIAIINNLDISRCLLYDIVPDTHYDKHVMLDTMLISFDIFIYNIYSY